MSQEQQKTILLAEDDKFISRAYKVGFEKAGLHVVLACDGTDALEKIRKEKIDIVLLDIIMPQKNGFEVLSEIKRDQALRHIPVVMLSNLGQDSDMVKAKSMGALDYMVKSNFSMKDVVEKVSQWINKIEK